jgi:hypothetical protein
MLGGNCTARYAGFSGDTLELQGMALRTQDGPRIRACGQAIQA